MKNTVKTEKKNNAANDLLNEAAAVMGAAVDALSTSSSPASKTFNVRVNIISNSFNGGWFTRILQRLFV